ncbi:MAG: Rieske 2Fe-2S domain-containing protein [Chloroflexi bacterium]|jgi:nitrite reductase/ring-hydroxylating ferredoxin subunit|nr:Rieske 2Fe-2S domain-containing protein [Chloroflexota bacterium]MBK6712568.1 Rieske 2Fe-2S domain-containing protein [Chloroflexota bacterium]MBK7178241.1 Rieske 2Fe-2S domain-containing protein [Chloroflexota bacterium]MBK7916349.1 Rieske 2Fe-2S domain-containing protein [Chloroflexota bacterium]MBK8933728.1 Rieske 2Fe-2S domain-containing protein [Chloroflexota bacterium]
MNLFKKKLEKDAAGFYTAVPTSDLPNDQMISVDLNGLKVILVRWQGALHAVSSICPHAAADLSGGEFYRGKLECPDHGYCFDVRTGRTLWPEDEMVRLKRYTAKEEDGQIKVKID